MAGETPLAELVGTAQQMAAILAVPVIGFAGVLALLPKSWTHGQDGTISNFGVILVGGILLTVLVSAWHALSEK